MWLQIQMYFFTYVFFAENKLRRGCRAFLAGAFFFSEITRPWNFGTCFGDFELKIDENHDYLLIFSIFRGVFFHLRSIDKNQKGN